MIHLEPTTELIRPDEIMINIIITIIIRIIILI